MRPPSVSLTGVGSSAWMPLDSYTNGGADDGVYTNVQGTATYTLNVTSDDVQNPAVTPTAHALPAPFAGATANVAAVLPFAARAIQVQITSGTGTVTLTVVNRGVR